MDGYNFDDYDERMKEREKMTKEDMVKIALNSIYGVGGDRNRDFKTINTSHPNTLAYAYGGEVKNINIKDICSLLDGKVLVTEVSGNPLYIKLNMEVN